MVTMVAGSLLGVDEVARQVQELKQAGRVDRYMVDFHGFSMMAFDGETSRIWIHHTTSVEWRVVFVVTILKITKFQAGELLLYSL